MPTKKKPTAKTKPKPEEPVMQDQQENVEEQVLQDHPVEDDRAITHEDFIRMQKRNH